MYLIKDFARLITRQQKLTSKPGFTSWLHDHVELDGSHAYLSGQWLRKPIPVRDAVYYEQLHSALGALRSRGFS